MENNTNNTVSELIEEQDEQQEVKTYTADEVQRLIQSEADKRVTQALNKQKKQYEKRLSLSQLDDEARAKAEKDDRIAELEEQLKGFTLMQNKAEVVKTLAARGLNPLFADLIEIGEDVEEAQGKIDALDKLFKKSVSDEVKKRLSSSTARTGEMHETLTKDDFRKMTLAQQSKLYRENKDLYLELSK